MTRWLAAARQATEVGTKPTKPTKPGLSGHGSASVAAECGVLSVLSEGSEPKPDASTTTGAECHSPGTGRIEVPPEAFPHGVSVAGNPLTWTGRVVSLEAWRRLSEWEQHGPNGRLWCGAKGNWRMKSET